MSRAANCIRMLLLLKARGFMSREDLAKSLHTNIRNIGEYRKDLQEAGYMIESTRGKYGGYTLLTSSILPVYGFKKKELQALADAKSYMQSHADFLMYSEFEEAIDKVLATTSIAHNAQSIYVEGNQMQVSNHMKEMIYKMESARKDLRAIDIEYKGMHATEFEKVRVLPYELLHDKGSYYCLGYSLKAKDFRKYKFSEERMKSIQITHKTFQKDSNFKIKDHIGEMGLIRNEHIELELYVYDESAVFISEKKVGLHPQAKWIDNKTLYYKTTMEGKIPTMQFLLSLGNQVEVIAPSHIRNEIASTIEKMRIRYQRSDRK